MLEHEGIAAVLLCRWQAYGTVPYPIFMLNVIWGIIDPTPHAYCVCES